MGSRLRIGIVFDLLGTAPAGGPPDADAEYEPVETVERPFRVNGFEYEIEEAIRCIALGRVESPAVPHADTLAVLRQVDAMRRTLGVR